MNWSVVELAGSAAEITARGSDERLQLAGNPHTAPGHFSVLGANGERWIVQVGEITGATATALAWVEGFLSGSEPDPPDFGAEADAAWVEARDNYLATGAIVWLPEEEIRSAFDDLNKVAREIRSSQGFADFLRRVAYVSRVGTKDWRASPVDYFLAGWADEFDEPASEHRAGASTITLPPTDWANLGKSIVSAIYGDRLSE